MRRDLTIKTGNLAGTSDFRVLAPIKKGFVPALDAVTYKTRVKRVLRTLHIGRSGAHESELARVLSDAVERVGRIHSVGIAVLEPEDKVLLTVTFDGAWEAYVRVIWQKVSRLLDLIFCNTEGYVLGYESSYEAWGKWLKSAQSEASFLYATPGLTVDDLRYLQMHERVNRREGGPSAEQRITQIKIPSAEEIARRSIFEVDGSYGVDPTNAGFSEPLPVEIAGRPPFRHGVRSLVGLYRLADVFLPGTTDGDILHRAAHELLPEFVAMMKDGNTYEQGMGRARERFAEAVRWLERAPDEPPVRKPVPLPPTPPLENPANVQGGIIRAYPEVDQGCLLLLQFENPRALARLLQDLRVTSEEVSLAPGQVATNIAFTVEGLRVAGFSDEEIRSLPEEFVQGMERRAGLLGDVRVNHPRRWRLPASNWHLGERAGDLSEDDPAPRIDLSAVHAIVQVRMKAQAADPRKLLMAELAKLVAIDPGIRPLSLQWMQRQRNDAGAFQEHFGFVDSNSDPTLYARDAGIRFSNHVHLGELLCGYPNQADIASPFGHEAKGSIAEFLRDGSFLVVRKLRQDIEALEQSIGRGMEAAKTAGTNLGREDVMARMMGRWPGQHPKAGQPLAYFPPRTDPLSNDFHFDQDPHGELCPFHAHIRRAHPRVTEPETGSRPARIVRRGMSYGPAANRGSQESMREERGLVFMAYNANLGEQFERVQGWLSGGNSSGSYSGQSDPIVGLAEPGRLRHFRFEHDAHTVRMPLDGSDRLHEEPRPFVRVEWGAYLFAPSMHALSLLQQRAMKQGRTPPVAWSVDRGEKVIADLQAIEARDAVEGRQAWKSVLEDPEAAADFTAASVWAAIRERHGGVLRTAFGVLVANRDLVTQVLADRDRNVSIRGYLPRMNSSFGVLYLGLDPGQEDGAYERESPVCNAAIMGLDSHRTFLEARDWTHATLKKLVDDAKKHAVEDGETYWELTVDARELIDPLLAGFCESWFGLSERDNLFCRSGYSWDWKVGMPPNYPGHFLSPSRYIFQPHPGPDVERIGSEHGVAVRGAMEQFLARFGADITAPVTRAVLDNPPGNADLSFVARTIAGAMMGFIPTVEGNLRRILNEWLREGTLWTLRARFAGQPADDYVAACNRLGRAFIPAMQLRAVPELIWRTAVKSHKIGDGPHQVNVAPGDKIVAAPVSATQQALSDGDDGLYHAFGGNRRMAGHPTHACPGADPALAVMIGFFSALAESELPLRAGPGPLTLGLDGRLPKGEGPQVRIAALRARRWERDETGIQAHLNALLRGEPDAARADELWAATESTPLMTIGDSWLSDWGPSLVRSLAAKERNYVAAGPDRFGSVGSRLQNLADPNMLKSIVKYFQNPKPRMPRAIILGGGGNDVVAGYSNPKNTPLYGLLRPGQEPLDEEAVRKFIDERLGGYYQAILKCIVVDCKDLTDIPILIHAYDHPIPDGEHQFFGPWLKPVFDSFGITDLAVSRRIMRRLIDRLNLAAAKAAEPYAGRVHPVNLTDTLGQIYKGDDNYRPYWDNELHATTTGFNTLADVLVKKLQDLKIGPAKPQ